jgi:DNA-binding response OmpR family regulator
MDLGAVIGDSIVMAFIAVVDDAQDFTDLVAEILHEGGHQVIVCNDGGGALRCIIETHPDVVLLDIRFATQLETGWDILDQIRAHPLTADIPVIVSSAAVDSLQAREVWLQERGIPALCKPFDLDELLALIDSTLREQSGAASRLQA